MSDERTLIGDIADQLVALFGPSTSYHAGCAQGLLVGAMVERGVDARGGDISEDAVRGAPPGLVERLEVRDLTEPFTQSYDLISCMEVLEQMAAGHAQSAISNICAATDLVVLSSAPNDFAEPTHVNVRQSAFWAQDFGRRGFFRRTDVDASFISPWAVVFERSRKTVVELIGGYESLLDPMSRELSAKRLSLQETHRRLDAAQAPINAAVGELTAARDRVAAERDALLVEQARLRSHLADLAPADLQAERMTRLAMADEIIGLNSELAQLRVYSETGVREARRDAVRLRALLDDSTGSSERTRTELAEARRVVAEMTASTTWRIGRLILLPLRTLRYARGLARRVLRRAARSIR